MAHSGQGGVRSHSNECIIIGLTFQIHYATGSLQSPDRLVVGGVAQLLPVDRENGIAHVEALGLVGGHAPEDLRDEDGHPVLATALDGDAQAVVVRLDDANVPLLVGHMVRYVAHIHAASVAGIVVVVQAGITAVPVVVAPGAAIQLGVLHIHALQRGGAGQGAVLAGSTSSASSSATATSAAVITPGGSRKEFI